MDGDRIAPIAWAHPQVVGRNSADLRDLNERRNLRRNLKDRFNCLDRVPSRDNEFRLKLLTGAGQKIQPEMRQPLMPRPSVAHLWRAVLRRDAADWMKIVWCRSANLFEIKLRRSVGAL